MSKAILVLDEMPENCMECPLRFKDGDTDDWFRFRCHMSTDQIPKEGKLNNCLLKPLPEKKHNNGGYRVIDGIEWFYDSEHDDGWNDCIDEILGEE